MKTYQIGERDIQVRLPSVYADWLQANVKNLHVRNELSLAYKSWLKSGSFSINTNRFKFTHNRNAYEKLQKALADCPFVARISEGKKKVISARHEFRNLPERSSVADSQKGVLEEYIIPDSFEAWSYNQCRTDGNDSARVSIDRAWSLRRASRWVGWCESQNHMIAIDYFGSHEVSKRIFKALSDIEFPKSRDWISEAISPNAERWLRKGARLYHHIGAFGSVLRRVKYLDGRIYHWLTTCPKVLRRQLQIGGERLAEADLHASYFTLLAGQMNPGGERDRLVEFLTSGGWYEWLKESGRVDLSDDPQDKKIKIEAQRQLLFGRDWRDDSRPLWGWMVSRFPAFGELINRLRRTHGGPSGFAKYLSRLEGQVMRPALDRLHLLGMLVLPLHDGLLVGESYVEFAAQVIREAAQWQLGFAPLVRCK